ncbi:MAG: hypothetical protein J6T98_07400 [Salinivirgaceae bacterium]|nr:hypothetical protein [Salinivirgaceae bacterium]
MKNLKIAIWTLACGMVFASCENTNENPVKQRGENVVPLFEFTSAPVFTTELETTAVEFTVSLDEGDNVDKASIEVTYNGENATIMEEISSLPANVTLKAKDIIDQMGLNKDSVLAGDVFTMYVLTTKGGKTTRSIAAANIKIVCAFDSDLTQGDYDVVSEDWEAKGSVVLAADPANPYKIYVEGLNDLDGVSGKDEVFFEIDPDSYEISNRNVFVLSEDLDADWGTEGYGSYTYKIVSGNYNSCTGSFTVLFNIYCDAGDFGNYSFDFTPAE